jgi:CubicO group peptidase (beta-lactamase class C family)
MQSTTSDFARALAGNYAAGHAQDVDGRIVVASQGLNIAGVSTRPSGNHWSNVTDILRYIRMELANGVLPDGSRYIEEAALRMRAAPLVTEGLNEHYGMGLKIDRQWGVTVIHHGGSAAGYRSHMMWLPDHNVGAVILINSDTGGVLRTAFRRRLLELLFDGEPLAEADLARFAALDRAALAEERQRLTVPADRAASAALAVEYRSAALGTLRVDRDGEHIWFDFGGWRSEVASLADERGGVSFITISPGLSGYVFEPVIRDGRHLLVTREAQSAYEFEEVR